MLEHVSQCSLIDQGATFAAEEVRRLDGMIGLREPCLIPFLASRLRHGADVSRLPGGHHRPGARFDRHYLHLGEAQPALA